MTTDEQIAANRQNAQKSTGPVTPEGKAASRLNGLKHGLRAATLILPTENQQDFDDLVAELDHTYEPQDLPERQLVERMAIAEWKLTRLERTECAIRRSDPDGIENFFLLDRLFTQQARLERSSDRARHALDRIRQARLQAQQTADAAEKGDAASRQPEIFRGMRYPGEDGEPVDVALPSLKYPGQQPVDWDDLDPATRENYFPGFVPGRRRYPKRPK